jgi:lipoate-protein ligase B
VVETNRGGRATYHGPSQLVVYPFIDLRRDRAFLRARDVHAYLNLLEHITVDVLKAVGVDAQAGSALNKPAELSYTGVWVGGKKMASIGVAVKSWISSHGIALNVLKDPTAFVGIQPCGFTPSHMTALEDVRSPVAIEDLQDLFMNFFRERLVFVA